MSDSGEFTVEDLLAEIKPREVTARVLLRQDLIDQHAALEADLERAVQEAGDSIVSAAPAIAEQIQELEAEIDAARRPFRFRGIGRKAWRDLLAQHPPTDAQRKQARAQGMNLDHDPDRFEAAAIAASCITPKISLVQAHQLNEGLDLAEWNTLWGACLEVNVGGGGTPKSPLAGRIARANAELGITAAPAAFPDPGSLAEP